MWKPLWKVSWPYLDFLHFIIGFSKIKKNEQTKNKRLMAGKKNVNFSCISASSAVSATQLLILSDEKKLEIENL